MYIALNDDLGVCGNGQSGVFAFDHFEWFATNTANKFIFGNAVRNFDATGQEGQRIVAERHSHLKGLTAGGVFVALHAAVLAG